MKKRVNSENKLDPEIGQIMKRGMLKGFMPDGGSER